MSEAVTGSEGAQNTGAEVEKSEGAITDADFDFVPPGINPAYVKRRPRSGQDAADKKTNERSEEKAESKPATQPKDQPKSDPREAKPSDKAEKPASEASKKTYRIKSKGEELEVSEDDPKFQEYLQKGYSANQTWEEAARIRKENEEFQRLAKENPREALKKIYSKEEIEKLANDLVWDEIQEKSLPEEDKLRRELSKYKEAEESKVREAEEAKVREREEVEMQEARSQVDKRMTQALSNSDLPKNTHTVQRLAQYMRADYLNGVGRPIEDYVEQVHEDYVTDMAHFTKDMEPSKLVKFLGEDKAKAVAEYFIGLKKDPTPPPKEKYDFVPGKGMVKEKSKKLNGLDWEREIAKSFMR